MKKNATRTKATETLTPETVGITKLGVEYDEGSREINFWSNESVKLFVFPKNDLCELKYALYFLSKSSKCQGSAKKPMITCLKWL